MASRLRFLLALCAVSTSSYATHVHHEAWYQEQWCAGRGETEHVLPDRTRVDCLTPTHAIEFDWGKKWNEAIGQSLWYALNTNRRAGIVLIMHESSDYKYWIRLNTSIEHFKLPIDAWILEP